MRITLGYGFDNIYFGMRQEDVINFLGQPDKQYETDYDFHFTYFSLRCDLWFLKEDSRLHWIHCSNPKMKLFDKLIYNNQKDGLISFINSKIDDKLEIDDFGDWESYSYGYHWLTLNFEFDILTNIQFGHFWDEDDNPIWTIT